MNKWKEFCDTHLRNTRKWTDFCVLAAVLCFVLIEIGQLIGYVAESLFTGGQEVNPVVEICWMYFSFFGIWIVLILLMLLKGNRPMFHFLAPNKEKLGNNWRGILWGIGIGFGMNAFCALVSIALKDIHIVFDVFEPLTLLMIFFCVLVQSGAEELVCRLYLLTKLTRRYKSVWFCIVANSVLFSALHLFNPGINPCAIVQIIEVGILFSIMTLFYDSFWAACFAHAAWNFTQNILFGLPNSGIVSPYSMFVLDAARNGLCFDTEFGIEGAWGTCVVLAAVIAVLCVKVVKNNMQAKDIWAEREKEIAETQAQ